MLSRPARRCVRVNGGRLLELLGQLAGIGAVAGGGLYRPGFTPAEDAARAHVSEVARAAGFCPRVDQAGNLIIARRGGPVKRPVLLIGSHLDSVANGGRLDGAYGVAAGIEVMRTFSDLGVRTELEPVVIAFANEEGARFPRPFWGSLAVTGRLDRPEETADGSGLPIGPELARAGGDLDGIAAAAWPRDSIGAYLELHIEQGPVLEHTGIPIGLVQGIVGRTVLNVTVSGRQNHAGTTPMDQRHDALAAAARLVLAVEDIARHGRQCAVATVGDLAADPGLANVIPGRCTMVVDLRDGSESRLAGAEHAIREAAAGIGRRDGVSIEAIAATRTSPVQTDPRLRAAIAAAADDLGQAYLAMPSGAGHDAQIIASVAPIGMIFVPSRGGLSHCPDEFTADHHLVAGACVLASAAAGL
jgi:N-carbamoyl-L-amino-acid hydrolase